MNIVELINQLLHQLHPFESIGSSLLFIGFFLCTFVQISPIKINPWDTLLGWIGERFNSSMNKRIDLLDARINKMEEQLNEHVADSKIEEVRKQREYLIDFVNEGINGKRHTKESFENAIRACDDYEHYVKVNNIENGVINSTIHAIRTKYEEHLVKADFPDQTIYINRQNANL